MKKICILLAAYNGSSYIKDQITSIQSQEYSNWDLFVNIDLSEDSTKEIVDEISNSDSRINILKNERFGSAGKNFYDLIKNAPIEKYDFVAFADQDDIWNVDKLSKAIEILTDKNYNGYSSSMTAFYPSGKNIYINKSKNQKLIDYKFESAGPGCTYVFNKEIAMLTRGCLLEHPIIEEQFYYHDWLVYYVARNNSHKWYIDKYSSMYYRQHEENDTGANIGIRSALKRFKVFLNGWYFDQVYLLESTISKEFSLDKLLGKRNGFRIYWLFRFFHTRRSSLHSIILGFCSFFRLIR